MERTRPGKLLRGKASRPMRTAMPGRIWAASISSMGAATYRSAMLIRSTTGRVAMPGGDGVTYSPTSPFTSATMPSNGATSTVRSTMAAAAATRAALTPRRASAASQPARLARAADTASSWAASEVVRVRRSSVSRSAWRRAWSASRQVSRATAAAASASLRARSSSACRSLFHRVSSTWPALTVSDLCTFRVAIWPPMAGASLARCRALTDPARVLATVASTAPFSAACTATRTGRSRPRRR